MSLLGGFRADQLVNQLVAEQKPDSPAAKAGLQKGDVITMIDNQGVTSVDDFEAIIDGLKTDKSVALLVQRRSGPVFLAIRPEDS